MAKINYQIHTDAIKVNLIPPELTPQQTSVIYASETDVLNMALFGMAAKQWGDKNPDKKGDSSASMPHFPQMCFVEANKIYKSNPS